MVLTGKENKKRHDIFNSPNLPSDPGINLRKVVLQEQVPNLTKPEKVILPGVWE